MKKRPKIVVIGGGTGTYQVLVGLKKFPLNLTAIVTMADSGGSSGRLREELGILPPGDVRRALLALSDLPLAKKTLGSLFDHRFNNGPSTSPLDGNRASSGQVNSSVVGHNFGNLLLAALTQITGREDLAIAEAERILETAGHVLPVTLDKTHLHGILADGTVVHGETNIDVRRIKPWVSIERVYLRPPAKIYPEARKAILRADLIVLGPGDLYTSVVPNLLVEGVNEAICRSRARVVYICNLMTKHGETDGFTAQDFLNEVKKYLGQARSRLTYVLVSKKLALPKAVVGWYRQYHSASVEDGLDEGKNGVQVIHEAFVQPGKLIRHDPEKVACALVKLL